MANQSAKKRVEANAARLRRLQILIASVNALHLFVRFYVKARSLWWFNYLAFIGTVVCYITCYTALHFAGEPSFGPSGELIDGGTDLSQGGVIEYYHDAIYLSAIMQLLTLLSDRFWLAAALLPAYLLYLLWTHVLSPWIFTPTAEEMEYNEKMKQQRIAKEKRMARRRR
mmetsp:Transcript_32107/g.76317  ORF Transcript_32107/g.76317 Transcript_32107/m.76317 type:complete len:170 (-) Transcript_32107:77-586(-)